MALIMKLMTINSIIINSDGNQFRDSLLGKMYVQTYDYNIIGERFFFRENQHDNVNVTIAINFTPYQLNNINYLHLQDTN